MKYEKDDLHLNLDEEKVVFLYTVFRTAYESSVFDCVNDTDPEVINEMLAFRDRIKNWMDMFELSLDGSVRLKKGCEVM